MEEGPLSSGLGSIVAEGPLSKGAWGNCPFGTPEIGPDFRLFITILGSSHRKENKPQICKRFR